MMKNQNLFQSIRCALWGIRDGFKRERNFKCYIKIAAVFLIINLVIRASWMEYCLWTITTFTVFAAEMINSAIEQLIDYQHSEINETIKYIKDIAAAAVLLTGMAFFIVQGIVIISHLCH